MESEVGTTMVDPCQTCLWCLWCLQNWLAAQLGITATAWMREGYHRNRNEDNGEKRSSVVLPVSPLVNPLDLERMLPLSVIVEAPTSATVSFFGSGGNFPCGSVR